MANAVRVTDPHSCPAWSPLPHIGGVVGGPGVPTVLIGSMAAAVQGTTCVCPSGPPNAIASGSTTVQLGSRPAARMGDSTVHGGSITFGCPTVLIGG